MLEKTNLLMVKAITKQLLGVPIIPDERFPFLVHHPIFEYSDYGIVNKWGKDMLHVNILEDAGRRLAIDDVNKRIRDAKDLIEVYMIIRKSYYLAFLKYVKNWLSLEDFSDLLAHSWVASENPNNDANVSIDEAIEWFKECDKQQLMTAADYEFYQNLPDKLTVYRGVGVGRNPCGLSFTMDYDKAKWFAHRFDTDDAKGHVLCANIDKSRVLAYFNTRGEKEIVVDTTNVVFKV